MKFTCDQPTFAEALAIVSRAVAPRPQRPQLSGILLEAQDDRLSLTGTDLELTVRTVVTASVESAGSILLPARYLLEVVRAVGRGEITCGVEPDTNQVIISQGRAVFRLTPIPADGFPEVVATPSDVFGVNTADLLALLRKVSFAASREEARYVLTGVYLAAEGKSLRAVATDGYRLAIASTRLQDEFQGTPFSLIIPSRAVNEVIKLVKVPDDILKIAVECNHIHFCSRSASMSIRLIAGEYPNYSRVIPSVYVSRVRVGTDDLLEAVERASILSKQELAPVRLDASEGRLTISANSPEVGSATEELDVETEGEPFQLVFNARFLIEGLRVIGADEVIVELSEGAKSLCIRESESGDFRYVVLPMRLRSGE